MILKEVQRIMLSEKAKSRAQQRFFGMVRAAQKGEMKNPSSEVVDAADSMKVSDVKKFAKTKHKGLPEKKKEQVNEIAPAIAMAGKALLSGGVKKAAAGAVKQKAKQAVKQKAAEVAGNVADKISKPIGGTRVQESKGTAELAGLALRGKKRCAHCGSFTHVTGQCPKKEHGVVNKRTVTSEAKSGVTEGVMDIVRKYTDKKKPEKKAEKAQDAGARAKRKLARKVHATYVSGSEDNVPDDIRDHKTWNDFKKHIN